MMFVFSSLAMMNANSNISNDVNSAIFEEREALDCYDKAWFFEAAMGGGYEYFAQAYDACCQC